jgi:hypothetical protein
MQQQNNNDKNRSDKPDQPGYGPQGIDKAPGEETNKDNVQFKEETQKGKKVDADLSNQSERPGEQNL